MDVAAENQGCARKSPISREVPATAPPVNNHAASDTIEIVLPDGSRVRVGSGVNLSALRRVMTALRG